MYIQPLPKTGQLMAAWSGNYVCISINGGDED